MKAHSISAVLGGVSLMVLATLAVGAAGVIVTQNPPGLNFLGFNTVDSPCNGPPLFARVPLKNRMDLKVRFENATGKSLTFREGASISWIFPISTISGPNPLTRFTAKQRR